MVPFIVSRMILLLPALLTGCAAQALSTHEDASPSEVLPPPKNAPIAGRIAQEQQNQARRSGFSLLVDGEAALATRLAMVDTAVQSIDAQYYIWHNDAAGRLLLSHIIDAAERGVRVRLLIDDVHKGEDRGLLQALDTHPLIQIRLFNPAQTGSRGLGWLVRGLSFVFNYDRLNHRMHNKVLLVDGNQAVIGGRNIGNEYFDRNDEKNFRDLDVFTAGRAALQFGKIFDHYWNSEPSVPVNAKGLELPSGDPETWASTRQKVGMSAASQVELPDWNLALAQQWMQHHLQQLIWAPARVFAGSPDMVNDDDAETMADQLVKAMPAPRQELLLESAYFIPSDGLIKRFSQLHNEGVNIRILTNSMRSNDVLAAHAGYADRRQPVLEAGADLHEWRSDSQPAKHKGDKGFYRSRANLHTKAYVVDREYTFIGSYNIDPRSTELNTECGILIQSSELSKAVARVIEGGMQPTNSWKVSLSKQQLRWEGERENQPVTFDKEPDSSPWQRVKVQVLSSLPIDQAL